MLGTVQVAAEMQTRLHRLERLEKTALTAVTASGSEVGKANRAAMSEEDINRARPGDLAAAWATSSSVT